jgi:hypothetical protein
MVYVFHTRALTHELVELLFESGFEPIEIDTLDDCKVGDLFVSQDKQCPEDYFIIGKIAGKRLFKYVYNHFSTILPPRIILMDNDKQERIILPVIIARASVNGLMNTGEVYARWNNDLPEYNEGDIRVVFIPFKDDPKYTKQLILQRVIQIDGKQVFKTLHSFKRETKEEPYPTLYTFRDTVVLDAIVVDSK